MVTEAHIRADLTTAMKARDAEGVSVLRVLLAAIKNLKVEKQVAELSEADIAALVRREIARRTEAAEYARKGGRPELVDQNERERRRLEAYLPPQLSREALEAVIRDLAAELGTTQIGPLMAALRERHAGRFDARLASELIRALG